MGGLTASGALAVLLLVGSPALAGVFNAFGPQDFVLSGGPVARDPTRFSVGFSVLDPTTTFTFVAHNGGVDGELLPVEGVISVNGLVLFELPRRIGVVSRPVVLDSDNIVELALRGPPGGGVTVQVIGIDDAPPTIIGSAAPPPNAAGWNNGDVTVSFTCADATSGVATCTEPVLVADEGAAQEVTGMAVDLAGNTAQVTLTVNLDRTPPSVAPALGCEPNCPVWHGLDDAPVTVSFTAADPLSGISWVSPDVVIAGEGAAQAVWGAAEDRAGNRAVVAAAVNLDLSPPVLEIEAPIGGAMVSTPEILVTGAVSDGLSGLGSAELSVGGTGSVSLAPGAFSRVMPLADGGNSILVEATDLAGNQDSATVSVVTEIPLVGLELLEPRRQAGSVPLESPGVWSITLRLVPRMPPLFYMPTWPSNRPVDFPEQGSSSVTLLRSDVGVLIVEQDEARSCLPSQADRTCPCFPWSENASCARVFEEKFVEFQLAPEPAVPGLVLLADSGRLTGEPKVVENLAKIADYVTGVNYELRDAGGRTTITVRLEVPLDDANENQHLLIPEVRIDLCVSDPPGADPANCDGAPLVSLDGGDPFPVEGLAVHEYAQDAYTDLFDQFETTFRAFVVNGSAPDVVEDAFPFDSVVGAADAAEVMSDEVVFRARQLRPLGVCLSPDPFREDLDANGESSIDPFCALGFGDAVPGGLVEVPE